MNTNLFSENRNRLNSVGPLFPPYKGPYNIPVLIDDVKTLDDFNMTRCLFFTIDTSDLIDDWMEVRHKPDTPFLVIGHTPVVHRPNLSQELFNTSGQIDNFFDRIEQIPGLMIETAHIWLPTFLLEGRDEVRKRGAVWRVSFKLFTLALKFQLELIGIDNFSTQCQQLKEVEIDTSFYSSEETLAFQSWSAQQIAAAQLNYARQKEDPNLDVLDYMDDQGLRQLG